MAYTAKDFEQEAEQVQTFSEWSEKVQPSEVILAALRIADNVMRPGFLEQTMDRSNGGDPDNVIMAGLIRKALTDG